MDLAQIGSERLITCRGGRLHTIIYDQMPLIAFPYPIVDQAHLDKRGGWKRGKG